MDRFKQVARIADSDQVQIFRSRTTRSNISYQLKRLESDEDQKDQENEIDQLINDLMAELDRDGGKMVIFTNTRSGAEEIAKRFNLMAYYSDAKEKTGQSIKLIPLFLYLNSVSISKPRPLRLDLDLSI